MKKLREKWEKRDTESVIFLLLLFVMAVYYGWRIFALTPWYDELYTYYCFISRGPVYAAIHWPLPNNHVGYSVLSAVFDLFGNAAIGLRGVSWVCSLVSLCLLFAIGRKCFPKGYALAAPLLYSSMGLVNQLAVQGRGYALASCLYLTAFYELLQIVKFKKCEKRHYIILAASFVWALYTLASSVYFVVPLCIIGGSWLFIEKRFKTFWQLFVTAVISALVTTGLYTIIWLAIGSNLLSKEPDSPLYQQGHIHIILHAPYGSLRAGMEYMLGMPYIQSVERKGYLPRLGTWIKMLFGYYYSDWVAVLLILTVIALIGAAFALYRYLSDKTGGFLEWYLLLSFLLTPLMLIIQAALPYHRVFSYFGIPTALLMVWLFVQIVALIRKPAFSYVVTACVALLWITSLCKPSYSAQYGDREAAIEDAYAHMNLRDDETVCVSDCDQEYLIKYLYDREDVAYTLQDADYVLLDKLLLLSETEFEKSDFADKWKFYLSLDEISKNYLEKEMTPRYENEYFILYGRK